LQDSFCLGSDKLLRIQVDETPDGYKDQDKEGVTDEKGKDIGFQPRYQQQANQKQLKAQAKSGYRSHQPVGPEGGSGCLSVQGVDQFVKNPVAKPVSPEEKRDFSLVFPHKRFWDTGFKDPAGAISIAMLTQDRIVIVVEGSL
jgi:hypothetical protein